MKNLNTIRSEIESMTWHQVLKLAHQLNSKERSDLTAVQKDVLYIIQMLLMDQMTLKQRRKAYRIAEKQMIRNILRSVG